MAKAVQSEGWGALLDARGAVAREEGREALAGRMTVLQDGQQGTGAPNEVSPEEMSRLVESYADIENGNCDLQINTDALGWMEGGPFQDGVMGDMVSLMQTRSGRQMLNELAHNDQGKITAIARADSASGAKEVAADGKAGQGEDGADGTDNTVYYVPGETVMRNSEDWGTFRSDVVLAHELTHAWYDTQGQTASGTVSPMSSAHADPYFANNCEHQAVGLDEWAGAPVSENAYRSERAALADSSGALEGDRGMPRRTGYFASFEEAIGGLSL